MEYDLCYILLSTASGEIELMAVNTDNPNYCYMSDLRLEWRIALAYDKLQLSPCQWVIPLLMTTEY